MENRFILHSPTMNCFSVAVFNALTNFGFTPGLKDVETKCGYIPGFGTGISYGGYALSQFFRITKYLSTEHHKEIPKKPCIVCGHEDWKQRHTFFMYPDHDNFVMINPYIPRKDIHIVHKHDLLDDLKSNWMACEFLEVEPINAKTEQT